ncbi:G-protein coupled receptor 20 [Turdus rufiventris]|nr:G-protein coupled receptor 20 [Turdus rufiventris]
MGNLILMANIRHLKVSVGGLISLGLERKLYEEQVRLLDLFSLEETEERPHQNFNFFVRGEAGPDLFFSVVTSDRTQGNGLKWCPDCWKPVTMPTSSTQLPALDPVNSTKQPNSNNNLFSKSIHSDEHLYRDFYSVWIVLMVVNAIIFLVGVVLNSLALYVFCFRTKTKTTSVIYTINLIVTDLLVGFFLPVRIIMFYTAGDCKKCPLVHIFGYFVNMYCSILFLTCICVDRYLAIVQVEASRKWRNPTCAKGICIFIWIFATVVTFSILTLAMKFAECCLSKILVLMVCEYFFPLIIIIFFTTRIMCALSKPSLMHQSRERRMRAVQLLITVLIIFMVCFTPFHVLQVTISINPDMPYNVSLLVYHVTVTLSSLNSCMDPIVYCFVTNNFQSTMKNIFRKTEPEQTNADIVGMNKNSKGSNAIIGFSNTIGSPLSLPSPSSVQI